MVEKFEKKGKRKDSCDSATPTFFFGREVSQSFHNRKHIRA